MSEHFARYHRLTHLYVLAQAENSEVLVDLLLDELDALWYHALTEGEMEFDRRWNLFLHEKNTCKKDERVGQ